MSEIAGNLLVAGASGVLPVCSLEYRRGAPLWYLANRNFRSKFERLGCVGS